MSVFLRTFSPLFLLLLLPPPPPPPHNPLPSCFRFRTIFDWFFVTILLFLVRAQDPIEMKKVVLKLDLHDDKEKQKALKAVSGLIGIDSIAMDMKERKLTVIGDIDPVHVVAKLRKSWYTDILTVGPAKDEKKDEKKKDEGKKEDDKKKDPVVELVKAYEAYKPDLTKYYYVQSAEENPNACVIC